MQKVPVLPTRIERLLAGALPALAVAWAVLILVAPWLGSAAAGGRGGALLSAAAYWLGAIVCHQRPERSFHLAGAQMPVCARCTGLYVSGALGVVFAWWRGRSAGAGAVLVVAGAARAGRGADRRDAGRRVVVAGGDVEGGAGDRGGCRPAPWRGCCWPNSRAFGVD